MVKTLSLKADNTKRINQNLIDKLEEILKAAKKGKVYCMTIVAVTSQEMILSGTFYDKKPFPYLLMGALEVEKQQLFTDFIDQ